MQTSSIKGILKLLNSLVPGQSYLFNDMIVGYFLELQYEVKFGGHKIKNITRGDDMLLTPFYTPIIKILIPGVPDPENGTVSTMSNCWKAEKMPGESLNADKLSTLLNSKTFKDYEAQLVSKPLHSYTELDINSSNIISADIIHELVIPNRVYGSHKYSYLIAGVSPDKSAVIYLDIRSHLNPLADKVFIETNIFEIIDGMLYKHTNKQIVSSLPDLMDHLPGFKWVIYNSEDMTNKDIKFTVSDGTHDLMVSKRLNLNIVTNPNFLEKTVYVPGSKNPIPYFDPF